MAIEDVRVWNIKHKTCGSASPMKTKRYEASAIEYEGWIFVAGGQDFENVLSSLECYDKGFNRWSDLAPMNTKRCRFQLASHDGYLYAAGKFKRL